MQYALIIDQYVMLWYFNLKTVFDDHTLARLRDASSFVDRDLFQFVILPEFLMFTVKMYADLCGN